MQIALIAVRAFQHIRLSETAGPLLAADVSWTELTLIAGKLVMLVAGEEVHGAGTQGADPTNRGWFVHLTHWYDRSTIAAAERGHTEIGLDSDTRYRIHPGERPVAATGWPAAKALPGQI